MLGACSVKPTRPTCCPPAEAGAGRGLSNSHYFAGGIFTKAEVQLEVVRLLDGVPGGGDVEGPEDAVDGGHVAVAAGEGGRQLLDHLLGEGGLADVDNNLVANSLITGTLKKTSNILITYLES